MQSYKDLSFDHRTGRRGGNVVSMLVRIPSVLRNEKMMNWVKKVLNFEKKEKDTFQFEAEYVPDTRKHHAF